MSSRLIWKSLTASAVLSVLVTITGNYDNFTMATESMCSITNNDKHLL